MTSRGSRLLCPTHLERIIINQRLHARLNEVVFPPRIIVPRPRSHARVYRCCPRQRQRSGQSRTNHARRKPRCPNVVLVWQHTESRNNGAACTVQRRTVISASHDRSFFVERNHEIIAQDENVPTGGPRDANVTTLRAFERGSSKTIRSELFSGRCGRCITALRVQTCLHTGRRVPARAHESRSTDVHTTRRSRYHTQHLPNHGGSAKFTLLFSCCDTLDTPDQRLARTARD